MFNRFAELSAVDLIFYIGIAILPAIFFMFYIYRSDRNEKESPKLLVKCILGGILAVIVSIPLELLAEVVVIYLLENIVSATIFNYGILTAIFVGLIEEGAKYFFLKRFTWRHPEFNYRFDGIVYAVFVSLGFAALENILYVIQTQSVMVALQRAILTIPGHMSFAVYMGLYYGNAKVSEVYRNDEAKGLNLKAAYAIAVILHAIFDGTLMIDDIRGIIVFFVFVILLDVVVYRTIRTQAGTDLLIHPVIDSSVDSLQYSSETAGSDVNTDTSEKM